MSMLNQLNARIAAKKAELKSPLERMGMTIYKHALGTADTTFKGLSKKADCCPLCGEDLSKYDPSLITKGEGCPMCAGKGTLDLNKKVHDPKAKQAPKKKPDTEGDEDDVQPVAKAKPVVGDASVMEDDEDAKKPSKAVVQPAKKPVVEPSTKPVAKPVGNATKTNPAQAALDQSAPANDPPKQPSFQQRGGFLHDGDTPPQSGPSASDMVQNIGSALGHRVEVNSDALGMGVSHAAMTVHPEWNQDAIKSKIKNHLEGKGWKTESAGKDKKSVTHVSPDGHKVHVHHVGHHMVVSSEDAEGTVPKALRQAAPEMDAKGKPIKKDDPIQKEELVQKDWAAYDAKHGGHPPAQFSPKHPKIDLHNKATGAYIASTNFSPNVAHAIANYEEKNPHMAGSVKGFKAKKAEEITTELSNIFKTGIESFLGTSK